MSKRLLLVPLLVIAAAGADVSAQTAAAASDSWSRPASASSTAPSYCN